MPYDICVYLVTKENRPAEDDCELLEQLYVTGELAKHIAEILDNHPGTHVEKVVNTPFRTNVFLKEEK
jgi:hypothetical protein